MKVLLDTNVLAGALGTRGLCADVLRLILAEHDLVVGEVVIEELRGVLKRKFAVPAQTVKEAEDFLRGHHVQPKPNELPNLPLHDRNDLLIVASALTAEAEILVTGDRELLDLKQKPQSMRILSPREFWNLAAGNKNRTER